MEKEQLDGILARYPLNKKDNLLPILQDIQDHHGYLTEDLLAEVGKYLRLPLNKVYGVATFYDQFRFHPLGQYNICICSGTACHLFGASNYLEEIEKQLRVKAGSISKDRKYSLEISNCMGACDSAPIIRVNDTLHTHVSADDLTRILISLKEKPE